jgi:hypothetical protein
VTWFDALIVLGPVLLIVLIAAYSLALCKITARAERRAFENDIDQYARRAVVIPFPERQARSQLYPRPRTIAVAPIEPPIDRAGAGRPLSLSDGRRLPSSERPRTIAVAEAATHESRHSHEHQ